MNATAERIADQIIKAIGPERALQLVESKDRFACYRDDPVGFGEQVLGESYTDDVKRMMESVRDYEITVAISANGTGKCVAFGERIPLADGRMVKAEELIGRYFAVASYNNGNPRPELAWAFNNGEKSVYRLTTKWGRSVLRTSEHPFLSGILNRKSGKRVVVEDPVWTPLSAIKPGMGVVVPSNLFAIQGQRRAQDDHVKLLGYLLGDGGLTGGRVRFTQKEGATKSEFREIVTRLGCPLVEHDDLTVIASSGQSFKAGSNPIINLAREWGILNKLSKEKFFPCWAWELPNDQLALLLNRLFSCDGWAYSTKGKHNANQIGICLASENMIRDVEMAMLRLGIFGRMRERVVYSDKEHSKSFRAWEWVISDAREILEFSRVVGIYGKEENVQACADVARSRTQKIKNWMFQRVPGGFRWDEVKSVEYVCDMPTVAIETEKDHTFLTSFVEHNTHGAGRIASWAYHCFPESQVYTAAAPPEDNLRRLLWGEIGDIATRHASLFDGHQVSSLNIQQSPRHFLTGVTIPTSGDAKTREAKFSGKHAPVLFFIFDEGDAIPDEVYAGREACTSGGLFRTLIMLNPRQMKGAVYRMIRDGHANVVHLSAFSHPNVVTGESVIPGAVDRNTTARRIVQMCRPMTQEEVYTGKDMSDTFDLPSYLEGFQAKDQKGIVLPPLQAGKYKVIEPAFCHMVLGRYPSQAENQLISAEWIRAARMRWDMWVARYGEVPPRDALGIAGLDVGEFGNDPSVWCARYGGWLTRFKDWTGVDTMFTGDRAIEHGRTASVRCTNTDGNGVGAGVAPFMMRKGYPARGVKTQEKPDDREKEPEFGEFFILRDQLAWQVREWLRADPTSMLPPDEELIEELSIPTYSVDGRWVKIMKADVFRDLLKRSPNKFSALCLTFAKPLDIAGVSQGMSADEAARLRAKHSRFGGMRRVG